MRLTSLIPIFIIACQLSVPAGAQGADSEAGANSGGQLQDTRLIRFCQISPTLAVFWRDERTFVTLEYRDGHWTTDPRSPNTGIGLLSEVETPDRHDRQTWDKLVRTTLAGQHSDVVKLQKTPNVAVFFRSVATEGSTSQNQMKVTVLRPEDESSNSFKLWLRDGHWGAAGSEALRHLSDLLRIPANSTVEVVSAALGTELTTTSPERTVWDQVIDCLQTGTGSPSIVAAPIPLQGRVGLMRLEMLPNHEYLRRSGFLIRPPALVPTVPWRPSPWQHPLAILLYCILAAGLPSSALWRQRRRTTDADQSEARRSRSELLLIHALRKLILVQERALKLMQFLGEGAPLEPLSQEQMGLREAEHGLNEPRTTPRKDVEEPQDQAEKYETEISGLRGNVRKLENELKRSRDEEIPLLQHQLRETRLLVNIQNLEQLSQQLTVLERANRERDEKLAAQHQTLKEQQDQAEKDSTEISSLRGAGGKLKQKLEDEREKQRNLSEQIASLHRDLSDLQHREGRLAAENANLKRKVGDLEQERGSLIARQGQAHSTTAALEREREALQEKVAAMEAHRHHLKTRVEWVLRLQPYLVSGQLDALAEWGNNQAASATLCFLTSHSVAQLLIADQLETRPFQRAMLANLRAISMQLKHINSFQLALEMINAEDPHLDSVIPAVTTGNRPEQRLFQDALRRLSDDVRTRLARFYYVGYGASPEDQLYVAV